MMGLVIGFDYGSHRIGVAVADEQAISVRPLTTLKAKKGKPALAAVRQLVEGLNPVRFVVGIPLAGGDAVEKSRQGAYALVIWLSKNFGLQVDSCDESYSSVVSPAINKDAEAASIILRQWLAEDRQKNPRPLS